MPYAKGSKHKMDIFEPNDNESCDKRCGEIFLTTKGNITIQCTLCETIYKNYEAYTSHIFEEHLRSLEDKDNCTTFGDSTGIGSETIPSLVKVEMEMEMQPSDNEFLKEEELPIDALVQEDKNDEHDYLSNIESSHSSKDSQIQLDTSIFSRKRKESTKSRKKMSSAEKRKNKKASPNNKPVCLQCRKGYNATTEDRINNRYHTCERKFLCSYCGRSFARNAHLKRHIKSHTNQRDFKCELCEKAFYQKDTLKRHMMGHSSERPFACDTCSATFSRISALRNHTKLHENKQEYKCKLCQRGFNQQAGLVSHMKVVHKIT